MLNLLTALRRIHSEESRIAHLNDGERKQRPDGEKDSSRLKKEAIQSLFHNEFVEKGRELPKPPL